MNLQRREEIKAIAELQNDMHWAQEMRRAVAELFAHIDTLEQTAAERVIAGGKAPAMVVPEPNGSAAGLVNVRSWIGAIGPVGAMVWVDPWEAIKVAGFRTIPAHRGLGEGMVQVEPGLLMLLDKALESCKYAPQHVLREAILDALRANQGGAAT